MRATKSSWLYAAGDGDRPEPDGRHGQIRGCPDDSRHDHGHGDRYHRGRASGDHRDRHPAGNGHPDVRADHHAGPLHHPAAGVRHVSGGRGAAGIQEAPAQRHRRPDRADHAAGHHARSGRDERDGGGAGADGADPEHHRGARPGDRDEADPGAAAERPLLPAPDQPHARRDAVLRPRRFGRELLGGRRAHRDRAYRQRDALVGQRIPARRRDQQRAAERLHQHHAAARSDSGVQGAEQQPDRGVRRVRRRRGESQHPLRHQRHPWLALRVPARRCAQYEELFRADQGAV